jgi:hypothetical protein
MTDLPESSRSDKEPTEDQIVETLLLMTAATHSPTADKTRALMLEQLSRTPIRNVENVADLLITMSERFGFTDPESELIVRILSQLADSTQEVFEKVLAATSGKEQQKYVAIRTIRRLRKDRKRRSLECIVGLLMQGDSNPHTKEAYQTLVTISDPKINEEIVRLVKPYLDYSDAHQAEYATRIICKLGDKRATPTVCKAVERTFMNWYRNHDVQQNMRKEICGFFMKNPDKAALSCLLEILRKDPRTEAQQALANLLDSFPDALEEVMKRLNEDELRIHILYSLREMKTTKVDFEKLLHLVPVDYLQKESTRDALGSVALRAGENVKPMLLKMLQSRRKEEYDFARNLLKEMEVSLDEMASYCETSIVGKVHDFFYGENFLVDLWKNPDRLRTNMKGQTNSFDYLVLTLFSEFNFPTLYVEQAKRNEGVDIVAFSPSTPQVFVVGCTTGVVKDDLQKLVATSNELCSHLKKLKDKYEIVPVLFVAKNLVIHPADRQYAAGKVCVLHQSEIEEIIAMSRTLRNSRDLIQYMEARLHQ